MTTIKYSAVGINKKGLKYTMDGGADGHDFNSSIDEIFHNIIDMDSDSIDMKICDYYLSFKFNINKDIGDPIERLINGVSLYNTQGNVGDKDISKYGKGIKCSSHCIFPNGKMILMLYINGELNTAVYNQGDMSSILPNSESSNILKHLYENGVSMDDEDHGLLLLVDDHTDDYLKMFGAYNSGSPPDQMKQENHNIDNLKKHISICYSPYLDTNFKCKYTNYHDMEIIINNETVSPYSHTCYPNEDIDENVEIEYFTEYECYIPYRIISEENKPDFRFIRFKCLKNQLITFDDDGKKQSPDDLEPHGLSEEHQLKCVIRLTKLSNEAQVRYNDSYTEFEKTKSCSYFMYRNGVCSDSSFISFEGKNGFRPTDCPQLRGDIHFDNEFDSVVNPASNKSIVKPNEKFSDSVRSLAKYVNKNIFKKLEKDRTLTIEGKKYNVTPKNDILNNEGQPIGKLQKSGIPAWDKLKLKKKEKETVITKNNNSTPLLKEEVVDVKSIGTKSGSGFRLYTPNPDKLDDKDDIIVCCEEEYSMITNGEIKPELFENNNNLQRENKTKLIFNEKLNEILEKIKNSGLRLINAAGSEINMEGIKII